MSILRAKTNDLFSYRDLKEKQHKNIEQNIKEMKCCKTVLSSVPQRLVLEVTNACNLSCIMCGRTTKHFQPTFLKLEWLKKFEPVMDRVAEVTLFGWGEPTIHPKFKHILEYLAQFSVRKYFLTNGMLLNRFLDQIIKSVDVLAVSLDGACQETNDRIRKGADFNKISENLHELVEKRSVSLKRQPYINFVVTLMKENLYELPSIVKLASALGIEEVKAVYLTSFSETMANQVLYNCQKEVKVVFDETMHLAKRHGIFVKLPYLQGEDPAGISSHKPCFVGWRDFFLGSDGIVRPCQSTSRKLFHINEHSTFMDMWNAKSFQLFRKTVNQDNSIQGQCRICYQSSHANWNNRSAFLQNEVACDFAPEWEK